MTSMPLRAALSITVVILASCGDGATDRTIDDRPPRAVDAGSSAPRTPATQAERVEGRIAMPDWFPGDIYLPEDFQATQSAKMGGQNHILRGITQADAATLLDSYRERLASAGYRVTPRSDTKEANVVLFHQNGISTGTVRVREDGDRRELQFLIMFPAR